MGVLSFIETIALVSIIFLSPVTLLAQGKTVSCANLHNGTFYSYPRNASDKYIDVRDENYLHETNVSNGDTSLWRIDWMDDCHYSLTYLSGTEKITDRAAKFMTKHKWVYEINKVTSEYYLFKNHLDKTSNPPVQDDTIWLHEKDEPTNSVLFSRIVNPTSTPELSINDTSKYALLCLYRPGSVLLCLVDYLLYFDNNPIWMARNNTGAIFKIAKEGMYELGSPLYKTKLHVQLNIKFGNVYYVRSSMIWGIHESKKNFKLNNALVDNSEGKREFEKVRVR